MTIYHRKSGLSIYIFKKHSFLYGPQLDQTARGTKAKGTAAKAVRVGRYWPSARLSYLRGLSFGSSLAKGCGSGKGGRSAPFSSTLQRGKSRLTPRKAFQQSSGHSLALFKKSTGAVQASSPGCRQAPLLASSESSHWHRYGRPGVIKLDHPLPLVHGE